MTRAERRHVRLGFVGVLALSTLAIAAGAVMRVAEWANRRCTDG